MINSRVNILPAVTPERLDQLDKVLLPGGVLALLPFECWMRIPWNELRTWMHWRAIYAIPTLETVTFLQKEISPRWTPRTLEIGAGTGWMGHHLGIRMTDSHMQSDPLIRLHYTSNGQPPIPYPRWVEKRDARAAVLKYAPDTVLACWVTQKAYKHDDTLVPGNFRGPDFREIVPHIRKLIFVGHDAVHSDLRLGMTRTLVKHRVPGMLSRNPDHSGNFVGVWKRKS